MTYRIGDTVTINRDRFAYISHPSITIAANGDFLAAFLHARRREKRTHPPGEPLVQTVTCRSRDRGETWDEIQFAPSFDWYGTQCPGISATARGTVLLSHFRFSWYPLPLGKKKRAGGEVIAISLPGYEYPWREDFVDVDWDRAQLPWARGYHGVYVHRSTDNGLTYDDTIKLDTGPYRDGYTRCGVKQLADGRLVYVLPEYRPPHARNTYALFSRDDARTWDRPVHVYEDREFALDETDVEEVVPAELLVVMRAAAADAPLHTCRSTDGGGTWTTPIPTSMVGKPGHLLKLADGRVLCTYGRRVAPFGIRAALSEDGGRSWSDELVFRDDMPNGDLGYPTTIEYLPGELYCAYYGQDGDSVTFVMGTFVSLT
jgi:hypothetical protein